jgi:hypothetical protein
MVGLSGYWLVTAPTAIFVVWSFTCGFAHRYLFSGALGQSTGEAGKANPGIVVSAGVKVGLWSEEAKIENS